jgi:hypothetical protein
MDLLIEKNKSYGDSAVNPCRIFSHVDSVEQINVRIDDKLNRLMNGREYPGDDDEWDLIGYLILKRVVKEIQSEDEARAEADFNAGLSEDRSDNKLMDGRRFDNVLDDAGGYNIYTPKGEGFRRSFFARGMGEGDKGTEDTNEYCVDSPVKTGQECCNCSHTKPEDWNKDFLG